MIAEAIARLKATVPALKLVEGAVEYSALTAPPLDHLQPAAFVVPMTATGAPNNLASGGMRQQIREAFGVVIMLGNLGDAQGAAASIDLETVYRAVRAALQGWQPSSAYDPCEFSRGGLLGQWERVLAWQESFTTSYQQRTP